MTTTTPAPATSSASAPALAAELVTPVGVGREIQRRGLDAWRVWAGYLSLGGTASFAELSAALSGHAPLAADQVYLLAQALNH